MTADLDLLFDHHPPLTSRHAEAHGEVRRILKRAAEGVLGTLDVVDAEERPEAYECVALLARACMAANAAIARAGAEPRTVVGEATAGPSVDGDAADVAAPGLHSEGLVSAVGRLFDALARSPRGISEDLADALHWAIERNR